MRTVKTIKALRLIVQNAKSQNKKIGFVPTMGALHDGHCALIRKCRRENDIVIVSIFVNPKQFGPKEDLASYPRPEKKDKLLAKKEKVDIIFYPSGKEMYPSGFLTNVRVEHITDGLCGASRPGHFRGVATVVCKLLNITTPDTMYLGQKDAQQVVALKYMLQDLNIPTAVRVCPIVREPDGLALSSRNKRLNPRQRKGATVLFESLKYAKKKALSGERQAASITRSMQTMIEKRSSGKIDYIACVNRNSLIPLNQLEGEVMIALAVKFGRTRLIDNIAFNIR